MSRQACLDAYKVLWGVSSAQVFTCYTGSKQIWVSSLSTRKTSFIITLLEPIFSSHASSICPRCTTNFFSWWRSHRWRRSCSSWRPGLIALDRTMLHAPQIAASFNAFMGAIRTKNSLASRQYSRDCVLSRSRSALLQILMEWAFAIG